MEEIERLQDNLLLVRRVVGWTAEEFGDRIGVTRQTINNIESGRNRLTKTQYIAMRSVLDAEMSQAPNDTEMLKVLLEVLVDHPELYTKQQREEILNKANMMAPSILIGTASRESVSKEWIRATSKILGAGVILSAGALMGTLGAGAVAMTGWLAKVIADTNTKKK